MDVVNIREIEIKCRKQQLEELKEATQNELSLTVYADQRYSVHTTNDIRRDSLRPFIAEAVAMTKYLTQDAYRSLPDPKYYQGRQQMDLHLYDASYEALTSDQRVKLTRDIEDRMLATSDRIITCTAHLGDTHYQSVKVHTNGFEGSSRTTVFYEGAEATVRGEGDGRPDGWDWRVVRARKKLPQPAEVAQSAVKRALAKVGQKKIGSGRYDMVIDNRTAGRLLSSFGYPLTAAALQQKNSFLEGKLNSRIASEILTVTDDPFVDGGLGSRLYDNEGLTTRKRVMIDKGILTSYYVDTYYGKKLGMEPTVGSATNTIYQYGPRGFEDMVKNLQRGIAVTGFIGGNSNPTTGDFSFGVSGMYVEAGEQVHPVHEMNISGNLIDLFGKLIELGNDPYVYSSNRRPSMYFKDVEFSGI